MTNDQEPVAVSPDRPSLLEIFFVEDARGTFCKPYTFAAEAAPLSIRELFWSSSVLGAVRGMHFQAPPRPASKLVWVSAGVIADLVVDIRSGPTYGDLFEFRLSASEGSALLVPAGFAHGFQALTDGAVVNYAQDFEFAPELDSGINWRSLDYSWPLEVSVTSQRDDALPSLLGFETPFKAPEQ